MSYFQSRNYGDENKQLRHLTESWSTDLRAYRGMGMVYLKEQNRALEAPMHSGMWFGSTRAMLKAIN